MDKSGKEAASLVGSAAEHVVPVLETAGDHDLSFRVASSDAGDRSDGSEEDTEIEVANVVARDGGVGDRSSSLVEFSGLLSGPALANSPASLGPLGNERLFDTRFEDTIDAHYFTPFYEGIATGFGDGVFLTTTSGLALQARFVPIDPAPPHLLPLLDEDITRKLDRIDPFDTLFPFDFDNNVLFDVGPIALPVLIADGASIVNEDEIVPFGADLTVELGNLAGQVSELEVILTGIPTTVLVSAVLDPDVDFEIAPDGTVTIIGDDAEAVLAVVDSLTLDLPTHSGDDFSVGVEITVTATDGSTATTETIQTVTTIDIADTPFAVGGNFTTDEDVPVALTGLDGGLIDTDGSETLVFTLSDVPDGASFNGAGVFDPVTGVWTFTEAEIATGLTFVPPADESGTFTFTLTAIATEMDGGDTATATAPVVVVIDPVVDAAIVANGASAAPEDNVIPLGSDIDISLADATDGSQTLTITLDGIPPSVALNVGALAGVTVTDDRAGSGSVTLSGTIPADVLAILDTLTVQPQTHDADNFTVMVTASTTDGVLPPQVTMATHTVTITPVADQPTVAVPGTIMTEEDVPVAITGLGGNLVDTDTSEVLSFVLTGLPTGATINDGMGGSVGTINPDGSISLTPAEVAAGFTFVPPLHENGSFDLTLTSIATETENGDQATNSDTFTIVVEAEADAPTVTGSSALNEDETIDLGGDISITLIDTDGSETLDVSISGFPAAYAAGQFSFTNVGGATGSYNAVTQTFTVTGGTPQDVLDTLASVDVDLIAHDDSDFDLTVSATTTDVDGSMATTNNTHSVTVTAVADQPTANADVMFTTDEDTAVTITGVGGFQNDDVDGSEIVTFVVSGVPTGATFSSGTDNMDGTFTFTAAELAANPQFTPPADFEGTINMTLTVTSTEMSNGDFLDDTQAITVTVNPVTPTPMLGSAGETVNEDTIVNLGQNLGLTFDDADDDSVDVDIVLSGIPTTATLDFDALLATGITVTDNRGVDGTVTFDIDDPVGSAVTAQDVLDLLDTFTVTPQLHDDANFTVGVDVTVTEPSAPVPTQNINSTYAVTVQAVADAPVVMGSGTGPEDSAAIAVPMSVALTDNDGSETVTSVVVSDIPAGATFNIGTIAGVTIGRVTEMDGSETVTFQGPLADINTLLGAATITPEADNGDDIVLTLTANTEETSPTDPGDPSGGIAVTTNSASTSVVVDVVPQADTPDVQVPNETIITQENVAVALENPSDGSLPLGGALNDLDGSETLTFTITANSVPAGADFADVVFTAPGGGSIGTFNAGTNTFSFTAAEIAGGVEFTSPAGVAGNYDLQLTSIATDAATDDPETTADNSASFLITVEDEAGPPVVTGSTTVDEDEGGTGVVTFGPNVSVATADTDGSEQITSVTLSNFAGPAGIATIVSGISFSLSGSASVDTSTPGTFVITSSNPDLALAAADIQATLDTFALTLTTHDDDNITFDVEGTTEDSDGTTASTPTPVEHEILVRAVADDPTATALDVSGNEDTTIALNLSSAASADVDGSETLSARITGIPTDVTLSSSLGSLPAGAAIVLNGSVYEITAASAADLDTVLGSLQVDFPTHFPTMTTDSFTATLEVTSTEAATGAEVAVATAVDTSDFTVTVNAVADGPDLSVTPSTGALAGFEDTPIQLFIDAPVIDDDGSEELTELVIANVPEGGQIVDGMGNPLGVSSAPVGGVFTVTITDPAELTAIFAAVPPDIFVIAPEHSNDDFTLQVSATTTEDVPGNAGDGDMATAGPLNLDVEVIGVADAPVLPNVTLTGTEDTAITLGMQLFDAIDAANVFVDVDGSETPFLIISGLPTGVIPSNTTFIGNNTYQVEFSETALDLVTIDPPANFSGDYIASVAPSLAFSIVVQEDDGNQATVSVPISSFEVAPVVDGDPVIGSSVIAIEDTVISLANADNNIGFSDGDGSETFDSLTFDFTNIIADAEIGTQLGNLGTALTPQAFIANHVNGTFTDNGDGTITVLPANVNGLTLDAEPFLDSNVDFSIPVTAAFTDTDGLATPTTDNGTNSGSFSIDLVGDADVPTANAADTTGDAGVEIPLTLSGVSTDTDVALGRTLSETVDYFIQVESNPDNLDFAFTDGSGNFVGLNLGGGRFSFADAAELSTVHLLANNDTDVGITNLEFSLTSVARENDGDLETFSIPANFTVVVDTSTITGAGTAPATPTFTPDPMAPSATATTGGPEDGSSIFDLAVGSEAGTSTAVVFSNIPAGLTITGAVLDPDTGDFFADADDVNAGLVSFSVTPGGPLADFSGDVTITAEAVSTNLQLQSTSTGEIDFTIPIAAVADGPSISANPPSVEEDNAVALNISIGNGDSDGSETINFPVSVIVPDTVSLTGVAAAPSSGGGFLTYSVTAAELPNIALVPPTDEFGAFPVTVEASSTEASNGDSATTVFNFNVTVDAEADAPNATAGNSTGTEDTAISLSGLSASLVDTSDEVLSVTITGIPVDTILSAGSNNGDGSWTIPAASLGSLTLTPPLNFAGTLNLTLNAITLDADGSTATTSVPFTVTVEGEADDVALLPIPATVNEDTAVTLDLGITLEDANETLELVFTNLTDGALAAPSGGTLVDNGGGQFTFTGTLAEANALTFTGASNFSGDVTFDVAATAIQGASRGTTVNDQVSVTVDPVADGLTLAPVNPTDDADTAIALDLGEVVPDADETVQLVFTGVANGTLGAGSGTLVDDGGGQFTFTGTAADVDTLTFTADETFAGDVTIGIAGSTIDGTDTSGVFNSSITITVNPIVLNLTGTSGSDTLNGGSLGDTLSGLGGTDILNGAAGDDILLGGGGADTLTGGLGADTLTGGNGGDTFVYGVGDNDGNVDAITDFNASGGDALDLSALVSVGGGDVADFVQLEESGGDTTVSVDVDGSAPGESPVDIAVLEGVTGLDDVATLVANNTVVV